MSYQPPPEQPGGPPPGPPPEGPSEGGTPTTNIPPQGGQGGYTPPSGGGYTPPEQPGGYTPPPGGGYTPPQAGGYTPPPSGGTPTTNIPQGGQGGYTPPPPGGYTPPPSGGYTPPEQPGGYTPPPGGGYTPPPPGGYTPPPAGGYGSPPPPPPPTGGMGGPMGSMGGAGGIDFQDLVRGYQGAVMTPNTQFYESQIPKANVLKILVGLGIVIVVDIIVGLIGASAVASQLGPLRDQFRSQGIPFDPGLFAGGGGIGAALLQIVFVPLFFFIGSAIIYGVAKMLGGQGADFMTHSYLLSLSYVPLGVISSVLSLIPGVGGLVALVALVYRQYSQGKSLEASQRMVPGRAQAAAFIPFGIAVVLFCLCVLLLIFGLAAAFSGARR